MTASAPWTAFPSSDDVRSDGTLTVLAVVLAVASRAGSRSAVKTFCSMCQSCGCLAIPSWNTLASCWVMAVIFSGPVPVSGTGISG